MKKGRKIFLIILGFVLAGGFVFGAKIGIDESKKHTDLYNEYGYQVAIAKDMKEDIEINYPDYSYMNEQDLLYQHYRVYCDKIIKYEDLQSREKIFMNLSNISVYICIICAIAIPAICFKAANKKATKPIEEDY